MPIDIFSQRELLEIRRDMRLEAPTDFWRRTFFGGAPHFSENKEISFGKIVGFRQMAPFALPTHMGKPIYKERGASLESFLPGYIKLLDAVRPQDATTLTTDEILTGDRLDMTTRFGLRTAEVSMQHMDAIYRRWDWMCAKAVIDGAVTVNYENEQGQANPSVTISYGRDANLTVTGIDWSSAGADILGNLGSWTTLMRKAQFGGSPATMLVGTNVAPLFQKNTGILSLLSTQSRGGERTSVERGIYAGNDRANEPTYVCTLAGNGVTIDVYCYSDQQYDSTGAAVEVLGVNDIVLLAPGYQGRMAYGAIYDVNGGQGVVRADVFQKQWEEENPSQISMLSQSAPLPIPLTVNKSFKATVL